MDSKKLRSYLSVQAGFSLFELLIAVAIVSVLASAAIPSFTTMQQKGSVTVSANELASSYRRARSEAVKRAQRVTVCKSNSISSASPSCDTSANWQDGWLVYVDGNENGVKDTAEVLLYVHDQLQFGVAVITSAIFADNVSYNPTGATTTSANVFSSGAVTVDFTGLSKTLSLSPTGRVRVN